MPGPWGRALEALRHSKRLTKVAFAKRVGITATTYGKIEKGGHTLTSKLQRIADTFHVPIEAVLQNQGLHAHNDFGKSEHPPGKGSAHGGQGAPVSDAADIRELQQQVAILQGELAKISARSEADRRQRVQPPRTRKPGRAKNAGKSR